jgi:hypothetical protein
MDNKARLGIKPWQRHPSIRLTLLNKQHSKKEISAQKRPINDLHRTKIHLRSLTL